MSNDEEPHYTSPPSPVVRNLKCVDAESYKTAEALLDDLLELAKERDEIRKQRDEARRELCAARREVCRDEAFIRLQRHRVHRDSEDVVGLAKEIAVERGWDCFKENTND